MKMKQYFVKTVEDASEIEDVEKLYISEFTHGTPGYEPRTSAKLVYLKDKGFICQMESEETDLRAVATEPNGETYKDSCLEFFVNFAPEAGSFYLNLEGNPIGTLYCKYGKDRYGRKPLSDCGCAVVPQTRVLHTESGWGLEFFIDLVTVRALFKKDRFKKGDVILGNFYKCGDLTIHPHFGMWNRVETEQPDFHRPEFFGELIID